MRRSASFFPDRRGFCSRGGIGRKGGGRERKITGEPTMANEIPLPFPPPLHMVEEDPFIPLRRRRRPRWYSIGYTNVTLEKRGWGQTKMPAKVEKGRSVFPYSSHPQYHICNGKRKGEGNRYHAENWRCCIASALVHPSSFQEKVESSPRKISPPFLLPFPL